MPTSRQSMMSPDCPCELPLLVHSCLKPASFIVSLATSLCPRAPSVSCAHTTLLTWDTVRLTSMIAGCCSRVGEATCLCEGSLAATLHAFKGPWLWDSERHGLADSEKNASGCFPTSCVKQLLLMPLKASVCGPGSRRCACSSVQEMG